MSQLDPNSDISYGNLFNTMTQGVVYQNADGKIISANPSAEKILGLSFDQMTGRTSMDPSWKAIHEDGSDFIGEEHPAMLALLTGEKVVNTIMGVFNPEIETYRWIRINAIPEFRGGELKPYQVYTTFDDITERRHAEVERENLIIELQKALEEVKTLRSILPLCSFCKKIRDDRGYWEQVDVYLQKHSLVDISHSICPKCAKEHYPEYDVKRD